MNNTIEIFKPGLAELRALAERHRGIVINGTDDTAGYDAAKAARKELGQWRIDITKAGKKYREEALAYQREVLRQEKEHLEIITPVEDALKAMIEGIDEEKKREERKELLPTRRALIAEIGVEMTDDEILSHDEKSFGELYTAKRMEYLERKETERRAEEQKKLREAEIEEAKKAAAEKARVEAEQRAEREKAEAVANAQREKDEEIARIKREQEAKEAAEKAENERKEREEAARAAAEKAEQERAEKNRRYKNWLKKNGVEPNDPKYKVERLGTSFVLWEKKDEIVIA